MEKATPSHVKVTRRLAIGVIIVGELILVLGPLLAKPLDWLARQSADWWGAAGQWAGALGSFAAVVVALAIAGSGTREARARERRRQQATATLVRGEFELSGNPYRVALINDSPLPVFDVQIKEVRGWRLPEVRRPFRGWQPTAVLPPGKRVFVEAVVMAGAKEGISEWLGYTVVIEFSTEEYRWRREGDGLPGLVE
ncbi:hypothetical protein GCM10022243_25730 [Saccharothrix violaceirubra]|uniref:Uncharacterized protein n=1 Tax=Saccharothrix violaceirubra TaxID=413306 RepID=A0A7W7T6D3_9PSEU|nr:hypothetical protein [Saccharothrix violaceirubra]MBB4966060.1 hypothetical protein [Saccharothrix violaceirubra]